MAGPLITAPDIRSLAAKLEIPASVAEESVHAWNNFLISSESKDPLTERVQFHPSRRPIEATHQCWPVSLEENGWGFVLPVVVLRPQSPCKSLTFGESQSPDYMLRVIALVD